ncbi:hypothetical protein An17g01600 [Aspergillus niger]|uniref:Uncharacterized protein n=2 Tax=Aspergillus niger TaxID=5061 RepID=A2R9J0_ASPNC|nr:hypothetical protein An17g01600 [Aspergillus niger]CAK43056.1 hypothetical protein An17g01600 [Aspergillus niger]
MCGEGVANLSYLTQKKGMGKQNMQKWRWSGSLGTSMMGSLNASKLYLLASRYYYQKLWKRGNQEKVYTTRYAHRRARAMYLLLLLFTDLGDDFLGASFFLGAICQVSSLSKHYTHTQTQPTIDTSTAYHSQRLW